MIATREEAIDLGLALEDEVGAFVWDVSVAMGTPGEVPPGLYGALMRLNRAVGHVCWRMASRLEDACEISSAHEPSTHDRTGGSPGVAARVHPPQGAGGPSQR